MKKYKLALDPNSNFCFLNPYEEVKEGYEYWICSLSYKEICDILKILQIEISPKINDFIISIEEDKSINIQPLY